MISNCYRTSLIKLTQPIGTFYMTSIPAYILKDITYSREHREFNNGIQRKLDKKRVKEISMYCSDPDATFPTSIVLCIDKSEKGKSYDISEDSEGSMSIEFNKYSKFAEVIDGQHRLEGIKQSDYIKDFDIPIILMLDLNDEEKAYVFSIINGKQNQMNKSLLYNLFGIMESRGPEKTCHIIARSLNSDEESPFFRKMKMLGCASSEGQTLTQSTFITKLLKLISESPDEDRINIKNKVNLIDNKNLPLRYYFINNADNKIYKILLNLFDAVSEVFPYEWNQSNKEYYIDKYGNKRERTYILNRAIGYGAIMGAFKKMYELGDKRNTLKKEFFKECFEECKNILEDRKVKLTSEYFSTGRGEKELTNIIELAVSNIDKKYN